MKAIWIGLAAALALAGTARAQGCAPSQDLSFVCGLTGAPEDLVGPVGDWIIASGFSGTAPGAAAGGITLIDAKARTAMRAAWGGTKAKAPFTDCDGPPDVTKFQTHGLNLRKGRLYAVGHGGREAIEVFDVVGGKGPPKLTWIGCVKPLEGAFVNSVAPLPDGRVAFTDFLHAGSTMQDAIAGKTTGAVYLWAPGKGPTKLAGSELPGANGIEVTPDGRWLVVAVTGTSAVKRWDLRAPGSAPVEIKPGLRTDNLRWAPDGKLLLAGPSPGACAPGDRTCRGTPTVVALDVPTLKVTPAMAIPPQPAFPGLSSALVVGDILWLGSPQGDKAAWRKLKP